MPNPDQNAHSAFGENSGDAKRCRGEQMFSPLRLNLEKSTSEGMRTRVKCED